MISWGKEREGQGLLDSKSRFRHPPPPPHILRHQQHHHPHPTITGPLLIPAVACLVSDYFFIRRINDFISFIWLIYCPYVIGIKQIDNFKIWQMKRCTPKRLAFNYIRSLRKLLIKKLITLYFILQITMNKLIYSF